MLTPTDIQAVHFLASFCPHWSPNQGGLMSSRVNVDVGQVKVTGC